MTPKIPPTYDFMKEALSDTVARLSGLARPETAKTLSSIQSKIEEEAFNLVVLGQFKRGKSTFINALLGADVLPTAIVPLTSVVTVLRYGPEVKARVRFLDGREEETKIANLSAYITERENPQNRKSVKDVEVFYPSDYLKGGVRIIDTPGVGSVYSHNTDVALAYLPHVDAAIFIVSADPPLSGSEHQFLKDVRAYASKLFFLLNKIDQVNEKERQESLEFTRHILEQDLGTGNVRIQPLSARVALEAKKNKNEAELKRSLLPDIEKRLRAFLVHEKGKVFLTAIINSLSRLVAEEAVSLQLEQKAITLPLEELNAKIARFEEEAEDIQKDREHSGYLLEGYLKSIIAQLDDNIGVFHKEKHKILHEVLEAEYLRLILQDTKNLREELEQFVFARIRETVSLWRQEMTEKISDQLEKTHRAFADKTNETIDRILVLAGTIFDLKLEPFTSVEKLERKSDFYFLLKDDPNSLELIRLAVTSALPRFIAKKIVLKNMKIAVSELLDRHCGRVRYDLVCRINATVRDFRQTLDEKIDLTLDGIRRSLHNALVLNQKSQVEVERNTTLIAQKLEALSVIRNELTAHHAAVDENLVSNSNNLS